MLNTIHQGHQGMDKCQLRGRHSVYWPGMSNAVTQMVSQCGRCQDHQNRQQKETLQPYEVAKYPWQRLGSDFFVFNQHTYLIVADYYSKFPVVRRVGKSATSGQCIAYFKSIISEYGIPEEIVSDNGPQYDSQEFRKFCATNNIKWTPSSPTYPQSNGYAERCVQTVKNLLKKALESGEDANLALLNYRSTPISSNLPSPARLLMNRDLRTLLPTTPRLLKSQAIDNDLIKDNLQDRQNKQKFYYDRKAQTELPPLEKGQNVRLFNQKSKLCEPATVIDNTPFPRSYIVKTEKGSYRRNRRDIRTTACTSDNRRPSDDDLDLETSCENTSSVIVPVVPVVPNVRRTCRSVKAPQRLIEEI
ncbi:uncharacterized protein K02A2.6-like [Lineus longissimus]|uniref:uncharacterized protein K02A2.6-like n=1 Tax=Lineus longissimus TaxID=88925 RepID=UPI00315C8CD3